MSCSCIRLQITQAINGLSHCNTVQLTILNKSNFCIYRYRFVRGVSMNTLFLYVVPIKLSIYLVMWLQSAPELH